MLYVYFYVCMYACMHWCVLLYMQIYIYLYVTDFFEISRISRFMKGLKSASEVGKSILGHF